MKPKKQTQILTGMDLVSHHISKMEFSVKKFNRFNNKTILAQVLQTY